MGCVAHAVNLITTLDWLPKMPVSWNLAADVERFSKHTVKSNST